MNKEQKQIPSNFLYAYTRYPNGDLDQFIKIIRNLLLPRLIEMSRSGMPYLVFVSAYDKGGVSHEQEQAHGLKCMNSVVWKAAIQVIDKNNQRLLEPL